MIECACDDGPRSGFLATGDRWTYIGTLTFADAAAVFEASRALALPSAGVVDLTGLQQADSSALAVMLAVKRRATAEGAHLEFASIPPGIHALAHVYGVLDLLAG
jgi:phospholipid transport system transporter-binding protein